jgi:small subunit ribosomal protein S16
LTDSKNSTKSGKFKEILGSYNLKSGEVLFKKDRITYWMSNGAQASDTVHNFLVHQKVIDGKKKNVLSKKTPTKARKELKKA